MQLDKTTYKDAKFIQQAGQFVPLKIDADKDKEKILQKYNVEVLPTIVFLTPSGKVVHRFEGYKSAADFVKEMQKAKQLGKGKK